MAAGQDEDVVDEGGEDDELGEEGEGDDVGEGDNVGEGGGGKGRRGFMFPGILREFVRGP